MKRAMYIALILVGLLSGSVVGCDASVQATVLNGLQSGTISIATALINAGFQAMLDEGGTTTSDTSSSNKCPSSSTCSSS